MTDALSRNTDNERRTNVSGIRTATIRFGLAYWIAVFIFSSVVWGVVGTDPIQSALGKVVHYALCALVAAGISFVLLQIHEAFARKGVTEDALPLLLASSFGISLLAAPLWAGLGYFVYAVFVWPSPATFNLKDFGYDMAYGGGLLFGWSCLFVTLVFAFELNDRKLRLAAAREEALGAQMRALRYQINPHFLFNTLNSIAGMIEEGSTAQAERMVFSLSTFLRTTLTLDPLNDVTLDDEIALQQEYLGIERERFSDRMSFTIVIDDEAARGLVPSLILQPLVENAIKHGVGATKGKVGIVLRAWRNHDRLCISVENDMPPTTSKIDAPPSTGLGLRNVAERLRARFRDAASLHFGPLGNDRFGVSIELPWEAA